MATDTKNLSRKGLLRVLVAQNDALLAGQSDLATQLTSFQETFIMALNANEKKIVDAFNAATTDIGASVALGVQAITDLFNNQSSITLADVQPALDSLTSASAALKKTATDADPIITPGAPPIVVQPIP